MFHREAQPQRFSASACVQVRSENESVVCHGGATAPRRGLKETKIQNQSGCRRRMLTGLRLVDRAKVVVHQMDLGVIRL